MTFGVFSPVTPAGFIIFDLRQDGSAGVLRLGEVCLKVIYIYQHAIDHPGDR